jgi:hypothetical protein
LPRQKGGLERGWRNIDLPLSFLPRILKTMETIMAFTLPDLPYAYDALAPHMSRRRWSSTTTSTTRRISTR